jgi:hypothetical protein
VSSASVELVAPVAVIHPPGLGDLVAVLRDAIPAPVFEHLDGTISDGFVTVWEHPPDLTDVPAVVVVPSMDGWLAPGNRLCATVRAGWDVYLIAGRWAPAEAMSWFAGAYTATLAPAVAAGFVAEQLYAPERISIGQQFYIGCRFVTTCTTDIPTP